jgi:hypothetical protein
MASFLQSGSKDYFFAALLCCLSYDAQAAVAAKLLLSQ